MKVKIGLFLIALSIFGQKQLLAQSTGEQVSFTVPKTIYFGGERIWISSQITQIEGQVNSTIVYAELLNRYNESVAVAKMDIENGEAFNFLGIPMDLPSDHYLLRVFTRISPYQNLETGIAQQFVTIFNRVAPPTVVDKREIDQNAQNQQSEKIIVSTTSAGFGEKISVNLESIDGIEEVSVSALNPFLSISSQLKSSEIYESLDSKKLLPELYGHIIEARVEKESLDTTQLYYVSVHGEKSALFTDRPDSEGHLFFDAGGIKNWKYLVAQADGNKSLLDFSILSPAPKTHFKKNFEFPNLEITPADEAYLRELLKGGQVEGYYVHEFDAADFPVVTGFVEDRVYQLDDYTRFETVETILKEYVPEVSVKTIQKKKEFRAINEIRNFAFDSNPLMLVDAMPVFDSDLLAAFDPKGFKTLEILTRTFYLNEEEFPGVISFSSYKNDFGGYPIPTNGIYLEYAGIQPKIVSSNQLFSPNSDESGIMDWRTILYWSEIPEITKPEDSIELIAPELKGKYVISVKTKSGVLSKIIEVK